MKKILWNLHIKMKIIHDYLKNASKNIYLITHTKCLLPIFVMFKRHCYRYIWCEKCYMKNVEGTSYEVFLFPTLIYIWHGISPWVSSVPYFISQLPYEIWSSPLWMDMNHASLPPLILHVSFLVWTVSYIMQRFLLLCISYASWL